MPKFRNKINKIRKIFKKRRVLFLLPLTSVLVAASTILIYNFLFWGKIFPGTYLAGVYLGGKTPGEALAVLGAEIKIPQEMTLVSGEKKFDISLKEIHANYDLVDSVQAAYSLTRTGNFFYDLATRLRLVFARENLGLRISLDEQALQTRLTDISSQISVEPVYPSVTLVNGEIVVDKGEAGSEMNTQGARLKIGEALSFLRNDPIEIATKTIDPSISDAEAASLKERAEKIKSKSITLNFEYQTFVYRKADLFELLSVGGQGNDEALSKLVSSLANQINRAPAEPVFIFAEGRVNTFQPAKDGVAVKEPELKNLLAEGLNTLEKEETKTVTFDVPVAKTSPETKTADINNLGIKELIGRGTSRFRGSIPNRIHNIALAASKFKGVLVAPGETFSFNQVLGDVSELTGFKQAYIIKEGKTVLGDGGGVCQVSTTLFRAILNAGLPILERQAHAYRVGYYEQDSPPGLDATVFAPSPDLKFKNDTPGHILIQSSVDTRTATLVFEIYGTDDGRIATVTKPVISAQVAPPEDLYIDDPTLPVGTVKQTEYKAWGAKVTFNYLVTRGGEEIYKKTFVSNYRPWQAVYLRGTGPAQ